MINWQKKGLIFKPKNINENLVTHASNPLAIHLKDNVYRVFYNGRDLLNRSSVGFFDFDIIDLSILNIGEETIFKFGNFDSFYSEGVSLGGSYKIENKHYFLFMGWQNDGINHWRGDIGRLLVGEDFKIEVDPKEVFIGIDNEDQISLSYPWVVFHEGIYKMWYGSTIDWSSSNGEMIHVIKYATSKDGKKWDKHGIAIPYEIGVAQAFSRPTVYINLNVYHMWYSYRSGNGTKYRIGYATSIDGLNWIRQHEQNDLDISNEEWENEMVCYPFVFKHKSKLYMLYNGNGNGKTGIGLATTNEL
jgi:hypothetical protein